MEGQVIFPLLLQHPLDYGRTYFTSCYHTTLITEGQVTFPLLLQYPLVTEVQVTETMLTFLGQIWPLTLVKYKEWRLSKHQVCPCSLHQPTLKCAKPELVRWTKIAAKALKQLKILHISSFILQLLSFTACCFPKLVFILPLNNSDWKSFKSRSYIIGMMQWWYLKIRKIVSFSLTKMSLCSFIKRQARQDWKWFV